MMIGKSDQVRALALLAYLAFTAVVVGVVFTVPLFYIIIGFSVLFLYLGCFFTLAFLEQKTTTVPVLQKWPHVSVIIPAYNRGNSLRTCLQHVLKMVSDYPGKTDITVINDCSTDHTPAILAEFNGKIKVITNTVNKGKANALNLGISKAKGEFIAAIDGDSYPMPDALVQAIPHFYKSPKVAAVTTIVRVQNNNGLLQKIQEVEYYLEFGLKNSVLNTLDSLYVTPGPFSVYRKNVLKEMGGYDTHNITEDMEITFHMHALGYQVVLEPNAQVYTDVPDTLRKLFRQRQRWSRGGWQTIYKYRNQLFSREKLFFHVFFPLRVILDTSAVFFLALALRMGAMYAQDIGNTATSYSRIAFETLVLPPFYINSNLLLYLLIVGITITMAVLGTHAAGAAKRSLSIPAFILFLGVYWVFILSTQVWGMIIAISGGKLKW